MREGLARRLCMVALSRNTAYADALTSNHQPTGSQSQELERIIRSHDWLMKTLVTVRSINGPVCYVGAGAVRDSVWDVMSGKSQARSARDIDVVYFDPGDLGEEQESRLEQTLSHVEPNEDWDVKNQAIVHLWFENTFGYPVEPLTSVEDAVATWPEYASCVAVRLKDDDCLEIIAPHGLHDLLNMKVRRNPARVTVEKYRERIERKQYTSTWPGIEVVYE